MLSLTSGSELLYVGDHMFSDVVRSKRSLGWRTALVVPELEAELEAERATPEESYSDLAERVAEYDEAEYDADALRLERFAINRVAKDEDETDTTHLDAEIDRAETRQQAARDALRDARARVHARYHPNWGPLFRTGNQASRFAKQVTDYACVYTSKAHTASNRARCIYISLSLSLSRESWKSTIFPCGIVLKLGRRSRLQPRAHLSASLLPAAPRRHAPRHSLRRSQELSEESHSKWRASTRE